MKKILFVVTMIMAGLCVNAQNNWQVPVDNQPVEEANVKHQKKGKEPLDPKYLKGGIPEVDGRVIWTKEFDVEGKSSQQVYDIMLAFMQKFVKGAEQTELSAVTAVNPTDKQIYVRIQEWLLFSSKFLSLDRTKFRYTMLVDCYDGKCRLTIAGLSYLYEEDRPSSLFVTAEEWITDENSLSKKNPDKLLGATRKFRVKTIDRIENILNSVGSALGAK